MQTVRPSITLWLLRVVATLWLAQVLAQVVFAAGFISGSLSWFRMHSLNGTTLAALPFVMIVLAVLHGTAGRGARWPIPAAMALWVLTFVQMVLGYSRTIGAHIITGTMIMTLAAVTCVLLWRRHHHPRPSRGAPAVPAAVDAAPTGAPR